MLKRKSNKKLPQQLFERHTLEPLPDSQLTHDLSLNGKGENSKDYLAYFSSHKRLLLLFFFGFLLLYIFFGMCISYSVFFDTNMFFGADNARAFCDLTIITNNHYRVKVHPLLLLLLQPIILAVNGITNHSFMTVILVEGLCGAFMVCFFYLILKTLHIRKSISIIFTLLYGFSFSTLIFSAIPENFIFAGLGLISYWYFVLIVSKNRGPLSKTECFLLIFWGIVNIGITLTNYVSYLIGLFFLLLCRCGGRASVKPFIGLNAIVGGATLVLCEFQMWAWPNCPRFWTTLLSELVTSLQSGEQGGELLYTNWSISLSKAVVWIKQALLYPLLASDVFGRNPEEAYHPILFAGYRNLALKLMILTFCSAVAAIIIWKLIEALRGLHQCENRYICALFIALCFNLILHYFYGFNEAFMYSTHYLFLFLLLGAIGVDSIQSPVRSNLFKAGLVVFAVIQSCNNVQKVIDTAKLALGTKDLVIPVTKAVKGSLLCGGVVLFILLGISYWNYRRRCGTPARPFTVRRISVYLRNGVICYLSLITVTALFIAFYV